jgi:hypothetical protein
MPENVHMGMRIFEFVFEALSILSVVTVPLVMVWGWIRWTRREKRWTVLSVLSLSGFVLATGSALLAIALSIYGHLIGGFDFYDPRLMRFYRWGLLTSLLALILALAGVWRRSALRWQALLCSFGTLVYWFALAEAE